MRLDTKSPAFILLLGAHAALPPLSIDSSLPALPSIGTSLSAAPAAVQWTLSGFLIGFAVGQILWGQMADRFGRRPVLLLGLLLYVVAGTGCVIAPSIATLILARLAQGLGACAGAVVSRAVIRDCFEGHAAVTKQALLGLLAPLAMLAAPILGGAILSRFDWRMNFAVLPVTGALLILITLVWLPETRRAAQAAKPAGFLAAAASFLREPRAVGFTLFNALLFGAMFGYVSGSSPVLIGHFGVSAGLFGFFFAAAAIALIAGALFANVSLRYLPPRPARRISLALLGGALCLLLGFAATDSLALVLVAAAALTFTCGSLTPHAIAGALAPLPKIAGTASGLLGVTQFLVGALSATLIGTNQPGTVAGMLTTLSLFAAAALVTGLLLEIFGREPSVL